MRRPIFLILLCSFSIASKGRAVAQPLGDSDEEPAAAQAAPSDEAAPTPGAVDGAADVAPSGATADEAASGAAARDEAAAGDPLSSEEQAQQQMLAGLTMSDEQRNEYAAALRAVVGAVRDKVLAKIIDKIEANQAKKLDRISFGLSLFALCGVFLLFTPFVLRKKYPNKMGVLFKYSVLSAVLFVLAVNLFAAVLLVMRGAQGALGEYTNPQVAIVNSTFDLIEDKAEDLAAIGPMLIEPTLASLTGESDEPVMAQMLANAQQFKNSFSVFTSIARLFKKLDWLFGVLPILLIGLAVILFAKVAGPTLAEVVKLPDRAASGARGVVKQTVKLTLRNVWAEAKATFATVGVLLVMALIASVLLGFVLQPVLEIFISYLTLSLLYIQLSPAASPFWVMLSLLGCLMFLVLNLAVVVATSAFFLGKAQQIFQGKFRHGVRLGAHARFWKWGSLGALWTLVLPALYIVVAEKGIGWFVEKSMDKFLNPEDLGGSNWAFLLASGPALFLATFGLVFWAARGFGALKLLATYKVASVQSTTATPALDLPVTPRFDNGKHS